jgi:hypothetical protein
MNRMLAIAERGDCHPERGAFAFRRAKDLGAPIRAGARKARILIGFTEKKS